MNAILSCNMCDKRGLPILLVRDAIAQAGTKAPVVANSSICLDEQAASYTKRVLRAGYIYLFDESRKAWTIYVVTPDGYAKTLSSKPTRLIIEPPKPFNCPDKRHRAVASCITIPMPRRATDIWISYSEVLWTTAVLKAHESRAVRDQHMVHLDVRAVLAGECAKKHPSINLVDALVAEYALSARDGAFSFGWNPFSFVPRVLDAEILKDECERLQPGKGVIVTLPDPAGIVQELAMLMRHNMEVFVNRAEDQKRWTASAAIDQIEDTIRTNAELFEIAAAEHIAREQRLATPFAAWASDRMREKVDSIEQVTSKEASRAADNDWKKYAAKFHHEERKKWTANFNQALKVYDEKCIAPLAKSHVAWMQSASFALYFLHNFDRSDVHCGQRYTYLVTKCVESTQDKKTCADFYASQLAGDVDDAGNIILHAMLLNQADIMEEVGKAAKVSFDLRQIPWENVFSIYNKAIEQVARTSSDVLAKYIVALVGPIACMLGRVIDGTPRFRAALIATGLISGHPLVVCHVTGTKAQFRRYLISQLLQANGATVSEAKLDKAVAAEMKRQQVHGALLGGQTQHQSFVMIADQQIVKSMPQGLTHNQQAKYLTGALKTVDALEGLQLERWRKIVNKDVRSGTIVGLLQFWTLTKLMEDAEKSLANERKDATRRLWTGWAVLGGTFAEVSGSIFASRANLGLEIGADLVAPAAKWVGKAGRILGIGGGLLLAGFDIMKAAQVFREKQYGLAWMYTASALIGLGLTWVLAFGAVLGVAMIPVIGILILLAVGIGIWIDHLKDNPIQDWLERCPWGILAAERYPDLKTQQDQLKLALQ